jgi:hypothetical protein
MTATSITSTTVQLLLGSKVITATVSYNATTHVATISPAAALASKTKYTVSVKGGASGVKDLAGNALASTQTWSFTTGTALAPAGVDSGGTPPLTPGAIPSPTDLDGSDGEHWLA